MSADPHSSQSTSASLLRRVQAHEPEAWERFATMYTPLVYSWARRGGMQQSDAEDIVQEVFRSVFSKIWQYQKQGKQAGLRSWLWVITRNCVRLSYRQRTSQAQATGGSAAVLHLNQLPDVWQRDEEPSAPDDHAALVQRAVKLIQSDFSAESWQAFWRLAVEGHAAADIAAELGISTNPVRQAKYRVLCRLRAELADF